MFRQPKPSPLAPFRYTLTDTYRSLAVHETVGGLGTKDYPVECDGTDDTVGTCGSADWTKSLAIVLKRCLKADLECGEKCTEDDILHKLELDLAGPDTFEKLIGADETVQFKCVASATNSREDCLPPDPVLLTDVSLGYHFKSDLNGRPAGLRVRQQRGHVHFDWHDHSSCEQAFSISRSSDPASHEYPKGRSGAVLYGEPSSPFDDIYAQGGATCGGHIVPAHSDDLTGESTDEEAARKVGLWQRYCVSAVSTNGAGGIQYRSDEDCEDSP